MENIGVSIILPLYNGVEFLSTSIQSIQKQTYPFWEAIIGVNGHTEDSDVFKQALKFENKSDNIYGSIRVKYYPSKGKPDTCNQMINDCNFDTICLLDVDDFWMPQKLERQIEIWKLNRYDVIGTFCKYFGESNGYPKIVKGDIDNKIFLEGNQIINSSMMIKKIDAHWTDRFKGLDDYDMWLRLAYEDKKFYNIPEFLTFHRIHRQSAFNNSNHNYVPQLLEYWTKKFQEK